MYKVVYLPTAEEVGTFQNNPLYRTTLDRYISSPAYYFFRSSSTNAIHIGIIGGGKISEYIVTNSIIPKHLLEVIEVPNV
ncbi:MAG: hypothetical protein JHC33_04920 [Ignisphaera sp.]|nr:hypothetical protein [Ignisphaera sp.]